VAKHKREPAEDAKKEEAEEIEDALLFIHLFKTCLPLGWDTYRRRTFE